jgi:hypothetical protein
VCFSQRTQRTQRDFGVFLVKNAKNAKRFWCVSCKERKDAKFLFIVKMLNQLHLDGYTIIPNFISQDKIDFLSTEINQKLPQNSEYGLRQVEKKIPVISDLARDSLIINLIQPLFKNKLKLVRALFYDKTQNFNWGVPWHQDKTIAVKSKIKVDGFNPWSLKDGIFHVQPPPEVMENILTVRIHLDPSHSEDGTLRVIPKTHNLGILNPQQLQEIPQSQNNVICEVNQGDILMMKPLVLHCSPKAIKPNHRRVIHLEYSDFELPGGLDWLD